MAVVEVVALSAEKRVGKEVVVEGTIIMVVYSHGVAYGSRMRVSWTAPSCLFCGELVVRVGPHRQCYETFKREREQDGLTQRLGFSSEPGRILAAILSVMK